MDDALVVVVLDAVVDDVKVTEAEIGSGKNFFDVLKLSLRATQSPRRHHFLQKKIKIVKYVEWQESQMSFWSKLWRSKISKEYKKLANSCPLLFRSIWFYILSVVLMTWMIFRLCSFTTRKYTLFHFEFRFIISVNAYESKFGRRNRWHFYLVLYQRKMQ